MAPQPSRFACSCGSEVLQFVEHFANGPVYRCTECGQGMVLQWEQAAVFTSQLSAAGEQQGLPALRFPSPATTPTADSFYPSNLLARLNDRVARRYQR